MNYLLSQRNHCDSSSHGIYTNDQRENEVFGGFADCLLPFETDSDTVCIAFH